jgi:hypothetical protein
MLLDCAENGNDGFCEWYQMPAKPGTEAAARQTAANKAVSERLVGATAKGAFCNLIGGDGGTLTCERYRSRA